MVFSDKINRNLLVTPQRLCEENMPGLREKSGIRAKQAILGA